MNKPLYKKGGHILTVEELAKQEFVFFRHKLTHNGWFMSWQLRFVMRNIGENGNVYYAERNKDVLCEYECKNCHKQFRNKRNLKKKIKMQFPDETIFVSYSREYDSGIDKKHLCYVCPYCNTDEHIVDLRNSKK